MSVNKVIYGDQTLIDISDSTVQPETLAQGEKAYNRAGQPIFGMMQAGASSWNDLTDKPFYEETIPAINITTPDFTTQDAVNFVYNVEGTELTAKLVRVGDYVSKTNILGATFSNTLGAQNALINPFLNDETDDYMAIGDNIPIIMFASQANATFGVSGVFSVTVPEAGIYFPWVDASAVGGGTVYTTSLQKAAQTIVHKLDSKFYDNDFWVTGTIDIQNMTVTSVYKTYAEILAAYQAGKTVKMKLGYYLSQTHYQEMIGDLKTIDANFGFVTFNTVTYADFGVGDQVYFLYLNINSYDEIRSEMRQVTFSSATGVSF